MEHLLVAKINIQHFVTFVFFNSRSFSYEAKLYNAGCVEYTAKHVVFLLL
jgi:hypothetical protein